MGRNLKRRRLKDSFWKEHEYKILQKSINKIFEMNMINRFFKNQHNKIFENRHDY